MHPDLRQLRAIQELEHLIAESREKPVLLFKHSHSCGVSAEALDELLGHLGESRVDASYAMVTVQTHRNVSNAVAERLKVRHETPQALLVRDGAVVWSASHFRVTASAMESAIRSHAHAASPAGTDRDAQ